MYNHLLYFSFWVLNSCILIFTSTFAPDYIELGNARFGNIESAIYSGFWITFIVWAFWDFSMGRRYNLQKKFRSFIYFFLVNIVAFWAVSKFTYWVGFQFKEFSWVFVLAFAATLIQRYIKRFIAKKSINSAWF